MNEELREAMRSVFDELCNLSSDELLEELAGVPENDIGSCLAYAGAGDVFFDDSDSVASVSYKNGGSVHGAIDAADFEVCYFMDDETWLIAA